MSGSTAYIRKLSPAMWHNTYHPSKISRTIRAAKTLKLTVWGMGHASESERVIYADCFIAIVGCCLFTAEPRMKLIVDYVVEHKMEFDQPLDISPSIETTLGSIVHLLPSFKCPERMSC
ncbi:unnamed protein product [Taenia asiatica]|uniref:Cytochrome P450 n=1 Tax=Taenia asiatica TaxID=60517 RepID=A0A0R3VUF7_TAEAS|nr:unnamed protein product [Taenia asiatica]